MDYFFPIFKDMQNWTNEHYDDPFPTIPFTNKPKGEGAAAIYRERLIEVRPLAFEVVAVLNLE